MGGREKVDAGHADEGGDGVLELRAGDPDVDGLRLDALVLGLGLGDVDFGGDPAFEAHLRQLQLVDIAGDGGVEELLLGVEAAQFEVVHRELGAEAELDVGEIGGAGLGVGARLLDGAADLSPEIGLPLSLALPQRSVLIGQSLGGAGLVFRLCAGARRQGRRRAWGSSSRARRGPARAPGNTARWPP